MQDLFTPLTDSEFDILDRFLLDRIDEGEIEGKNPEEIDEGVLGISALPRGGPPYLIENKWKSL